MVRQKAFACKLLIYIFAVIFAIIIYPKSTAYAFSSVNETYQSQVLHADMMSNNANDGFLVPSYSDDNITLHYYYNMNDYNFNTEAGRVYIHPNAMPVLQLGNDTGTLSFSYTYTVSLVVAGKEYDLQAAHKIDNNNTIYPNWQSVVVDDWRGSVYLKYTVNLNYTNMDSHSTIAKFDLVAPSFILQIHNLGYNTNINNQISNMQNQISNDINEGNQLIEEGNTLQEEANTLQEEANVTQKNIFAKISDFFDNFFSRLGDFLLGLIVPSAEDLTAFLDEVNAWFSDRLGFIWYPFGFAVDAVSALAGGDANTQFTVPALQINMLGGTYTIWNEMSVDMDAFDIFKYVRLFTSFICVGGIVALAYNKWDEWIGGHGVG